MAGNSQKKKVENAIDALVDLMRLHTISLVTMSQEGLPKARRSGVIMCRLDGTYVTMTAEHEVGAQSWFIETITDSRADGSLLVQAGKLAQVFGVPSWVAPEESLI